MSEVLYIHQIFIDCVFNWYTHSGISTCQMWLNIRLERLKILLHFWLIFDSIIAKLSWSLFETNLIYLKKYHINEQHLHLITHIFTKLLQNVCLIKTHILIYRYVKSDYNLWNVLRFYCVFFGYCYILLIIVCLISTYICYINIPDVTASYGMPLDFTVFFKEFGT